jgi:hypothetical protein
MAIAGSGLALADDNSIQIVQNGNTHEGTLIQTGAGNIAGTDSLHLTQNGVDNRLTITQSGDHNDIGTTGRGVIQTGTASSDNSRANIATVIQNSNGNSIGELVQTTEGAHATTGNIATVTQDLHGLNTIVSLEQVQGANAGSNIATVTQTGTGNWLELLSQTATLNEGNNTIRFEARGNYNGVRGNGQGSGPLGPLARASGATSASLIQGRDFSGAAGNSIEVTLVGDYNQYGMTQYGSDNSVGVTISGLSNSFGSYQLGRHNQITIGGLAADANDVGIFQIGHANATSVVLNNDSSRNELAVGQSGDSNHVALNLTGDDNLLGVGQLGWNHGATITATGDNNLVYAIQANTTITANLGNILSVSIKGDNNNGLSGGRLQHFTDAALDFASLAPRLSPALLLSTDLFGVIGSRPLMLFPGALIQLGQANDIDIAVGKLFASNSNLFAVLQKGDRNSTSFIINGNLNQAVALQVGDDNVAAAYIQGNSNLVAISQ